MGSLSGGARPNSPQSGRNRPPGWRASHPRTALAIRSVLPSCPASLLEVSSSAADKLIDGRYVVLDAFHARHTLSCNAQGITLRFSADRTPKMHNPIFHHNI